MATDGPRFGRRPFGVGLFGAGLGGWGLSALGLGPLLGAVTGCETLRGEALPESPTWMHRPGGVLSVAFRRQLTDQTKIVDLAYERGRPEIDKDGLRVFVGSQDGGLYAVDARSGQVLWRFATLGPVQCEPLYDAAEDTLYFGSTDGALYKVRARNGELVYRFETRAEVARKPVIDGDVLFFTTANDTLIALDKTTGKMKFYQAKTPAFGIEIGAYAGVSIGRKKAFTSFSDGSVMAYATSDGAELWPTVDLTVEAQSPDGTPPQYLDADATPVLDRAGDVPAVFVAHYEGGVYALEADTGRTLWRNDAVRGATNILMWSQPAHAGRMRPDGTRGPDAPARRVLVVASGRTGLWGLDPDDRGKVLWQRALPEGGISAPVVVAGAILVTTTRYGIFLFEPTQGLMIDGIEPGNEIAMTPAAHGLHAYVMTNGGELISLVVQPPPGAEKKKG